MHTPRVAIIGAGIGGLTAAVELARHGLEVMVLERAAAPGGKMREIAIGADRIDAGPTVLTMRWVFDEIFAAAGTSLDAELRLQPAEVLARHAWSEREQLDLYADEARSADAIGSLAGAAEARGFRAFARQARNTYETLEAPFIRAAQPRIDGLVSGVGLRGLGELWRIKPFTTLWDELGRYFKDQRLRQLFGRYSTYCGSSPFAAPATLMLIAHVEQRGVWLVEGGMHRLARALEALAARHGATFRYAAEVARVELAAGAVAGLVLADGERLACDAVIVNADVAAVAGGLLGTAIAAAVPRAAAGARSLSAVTWALVATTRGLPLVRHNVFFSRDYPGEFAAILDRGALPGEPTVYVCAQDRDAQAGPAARPATERLLCLVNAPAQGDRRRFDQEEIRRCEERAFERLARCGLAVQRAAERTVVTTPAEFERLFPATGGALYGRATHGWLASFQRPTARTRIPGLYLAGGSVHPGAGVPMAALSGRNAASALIADRASIGRSRRMAMPGGISTR